VVIAHKVVVCFYFADLCGDAYRGTGWECGYDRGEYFLGGVLLHVVRTAHVFMDES
jgi:hypothetical protein